MGDFNKNYIIFIILFVFIGLYLCYSISEVVIKKDLPVKESFNKPDEKQDEIVLYYAEWCGISRAFKPIWDDFKLAATKSNPDLKITEVRCEGDMQDYCNQKGVEGYPTVYLYKKNGGELLYEGNRTKSALLTFVNNK
jgi:hypothetical protein